MADLPTITVATDHYCCDLFKGSLYFPAALIAKRRRLSHKAAVRLYATSVAECPLVSPPGGWNILAKSCSVMT